MKITVNAEMVKRIVAWKEEMDKLLAAEDRGECPEGFEESEIDACAIMHEIADLVIARCLAGPQVTMPKDGDK